MKPFLAVLARDLRVAVHDGGALGTALGFNLIVVALLPLGLGPDLDLLSRIAAGVLWVALLLSALLSLPRLFEADYEDGTLEVLATGPLLLELVVVAKSLAHWISTGIPLMLLAPVLGVLLNLDLAALPILMTTLMLGTPAVSFLGSIGAALTLGSRRGGLLIALLVLPLYVPTLVFGVSTISAAVLATGGVTAPLLVLAAISLVAIVIGPIAAAAALRARMG